MSRIARVAVFGALTMALQVLAVDLIKSADARYGWEVLAGLLAAGLSWESAGVSFRAVFPTQTNKGEG